MGNVEKKIAEMAAEVKTGGIFDPAVRADYLRSFVDTGLPSFRDERYRHTDLQSIFSAAPNLHIAQKPEVVEPGQNDDRFVIRVKNGFCQKEEIVGLPAGILFGSYLGESIIEKAYGSLNSIAGNSDAVTSLNSALSPDCVVLILDKNASCEKPFSIEFVYEGSEDITTLVASRLLIVAGENSSAKIGVSHKNLSTSKVYINHVREMIGHNSSTLEISEIVDLTDNDIFIGGNYSKQEKDSRADAVALWSRAAVTRINSVTDLAGDHSQSNLHGIYFGNGDSATDIHMTVNHLIPDCNSYELVKGLVSNSAVGAFTGKVYVAKDAQRTVALQQNRNIQLSDSARIYTEPQLEIYADDVKCSHGATVGQMDSEVIYYMRQRGIPEEEARRLEMHGFVNDIISRCKTTAICESLKSIAMDRINTL